MYDYTYPHSYVFLITFTAPPSWNIWSDLTVCLGLVEEEAESLIQNAFHSFFLTGMQTIARMVTVLKDTIPKDTIPNGHNLKWTPSQMGTIPNGHYPEWTLSRMYTIPNGHRPNEHNSN